MIEHHDLGGEVEDSVGWLVMESGELSTLDVDLDVEANVIFGHAFGRLVVHLHVLHLEKECQIMKQFKTIDKLNQFQKKNVNISSEGSVASFFHQNKTIIPLLSRERISCEERSKR